MRVYHGDSRCDKCKSSIGLIVNINGKEFGTCCAQKILGRKITIMELIRKVENG